MSEKSTNFYIVGLGNPGEEYTFTRHNTGMEALDFFVKSQKFGDWSQDKKTKAIISEGKIGKSSVFLAKPQTFMNKSGLSVATFVTNLKKAKNLIVIHDDLDLPLGRFKIVFNRGSGGHKGIESIERSIKTREFIRIKVGISPAGKNGIARKPHGDKEVSDFILGKFRKPEMEELKKVHKNISAAIGVIISEGLEKAMGEWNRG